MVGPKFTELTKTLTVLTSHKRVLRSSRPLNIAFMEYRRIARQTVSENKACVQLLSEALA